MNVKVTKLSSSIEPAEPVERPPQKSRKPTGVLLAARKGLKTLGILFLFVPHLMLLRVLGPRWGLYWARWLALGHWLMTFVGAERATRKVLEQVHPHLQTELPVSTILRKHLEIKHHSFAEFRLAGTLRGQEYIRQVYHDFPQDAEDELRRMYEAKQGMLWLVYHFGMYKLLAAGLAARYDVPIYQVNYRAAHYGPETFGLVARMTFRNAVEAARKSGVRNIFLKPDSSPLSVVKRLRKGGIVGIAGDGMVASEFTDVPFLGGSLRLPTGWARLAALTKTPIITAFVTLDGVHGRHIESRPPFVVEENTDEAVSAAVEKGAKMLEEYVRRRPWDWHIWRRIEVGQDNEGGLRLSAEPATLDPSRYHYEPPPK